MVGKTHPEFGLGRGFRSGLLGFRDGRRGSRNGMAEGLYVVDRRRLVLDLVSLESGVRDPDCLAEDGIF